MGTWRPDLRRERPSGADQVHLLTGRTNWRSNLHQMSGGPSRCRSCFRSLRLPARLAFPPVWPPPPPHREAGGSAAVKAPVVLRCRRRRPAFGAAQPGGSERAPRGSSQHWSINWSLCAAGQIGSGGKVVRGYVVQAVVKALGCVHQHSTITGSTASASGRPDQKCNSPLIITKTILVGSLSNL